ncbi:hypothetical protein [Streptomyces sp. SHP 1-2]|uniref:hypothetical protein n=1 Tax=Streptomyces sp. SHP 1-2 TaxID=2769489 RepID=UPI002237C471|nr:hypothetical protein [Streptomyces sp. SHP 1-2]MCW5253693.1 hypothetical protein [Streptomyces sp. SHP 1-2]
MRKWWTTAVAVIFMAVVCQLSGKSSIELPALNGSGVTPLAYFTPLLVSSAVLYCLNRRADHIERTAAVAVAVIDAAFVAFVFALCLTAGFVTGFDTARNVILLTCIGILIAQVGNSASGIATSMMLLIAGVVAGRGPAGSHAWWAVVLYPSSSVPAWSLTAVLLAAAGIRSVKSSGKP